MNNFEELSLKDIKRLLAAAEQYDERGSIVAGMVKRLIAQLEAAQKERDELRDKFNEMCVQKQFWVKCAKELESQLEKTEAELSAVTDEELIQDTLIEQVGVMCDQATNTHERDVYGQAYCVMKYGVLPYLRKHKNPPVTE
ncbi:hypothetical protein [Yersinia mollaretii]|uniref:hypothetical protein n=1 Tax=Yersinia mollaretii TaxID=33060 RepID=UPI0011A8B05B|nr:hypothetical protein [Yersinia mollaretii]